MPYYDGIAIAIASVKICSRSENARRRHTAVSLLTPVHGGPFKFKKFQRDRDHEFLCVMRDIQEKTAWFSALRASPPLRSGSTAQRLSDWMTSGTDEILKDKRGLFGLWKQNMILMLLGNKNHGYFQIDHGNFFRQSRSRVKKHKKITVKIHNFEGTTVYSRLKNDQ